MWSQVRVRGGTGVPSLKVMSFMILRVSDAQRAQGQVAHNKVLKIADNTN